MRYEKPIHHLQLKHRTETGIEILSVPGIISEFYVISACHAANYCYYTTWNALSYQEQVRLVAHYLLHKLVNSHAEDAQQTEMERKK